MLILFLAGTMGAAVAAPAAPVNDAGPGGSWSPRSTASAPHHELTEQHKKLIDRILTEDVEVVITKAEGKTVVEAEGFTDEELQMIAFLLSEL